MKYMCCNVYEQNLYDLIGRFGTDLHTEMLGVRIFVVVVAGNGRPCPAAFAASMTFYSPIFISLLCPVLDGATGRSAAAAVSTAALGCLFVCKLHARRECTYLSIRSEAMLNSFRFRVRARLAPLRFVSIAHHRPCARLTINSLPLAI